MLPVILVNGSRSVYFLRCNTYPFNLMLPELYGDFYIL